MANPSKPSASASIIAAAVFAILAALFTLLVTSLGFIGLLLGNRPGVSPELPPFLKNMTLAVMAFMVCLAAFGIATGIGLIRLRNWARISVLTWGGMSLFFGIFGVVIAFLIPLNQSPNLAEVNMQAVRLIILGVYALPAIVGAWWLILFTRKPIKSQFTREPTPLDLGIPQPQKPRSPVAVVVIAWFFISSAANVVFLPLLPFHFPAVFFGRPFLGWMGTAILLFNCLLLVVAGVGLLKLKPWSYPFTIGLQLLQLASGIITVLSPNFDSLMKSVISTMNNAMHLPPNISSPIDFVHSFRWFAYFGLLFPVVIVILMFYYRERFLEAASTVKS